MKTLPSKVFPQCEFSQEKDIGFYNITPQGYEHIISLYLSKETVKDDVSIAKAADFFDKLHHWDTFCRDVFASVEEDGEDAEMIAEYFDFYKEEVPEVFGDSDISKLSIADMIKSLKLVNMSSHGSENTQKFVVDFTLGYDQILCVHFDNDSNLNYIAWES